MGHFTFKRRIYFNLAVLTCGFLNKNKLNDNDGYDGSIKEMIVPFNARVYPLLRSRVYMYMG